MTINIQQPELLATIRKYMQSGKFPDVEVLLTQAFDAFEERAAPDAKPDILYHYTNQAGLVGILNSEEIWASRFDFLNDSQEIRHFLQLCQEEIGRRIQSDSTTKLPKLKAAVADGTGDYVTYVCSFSEESDSLEQWRAYASGGSGFAIGFSREKLQEQFRGDSLFDLQECFYLPENGWDPSIKELVDDLLQDSISSENIKVVINPKQYIFNWARRYKHDAFKNEKEWRISCPSRTSLEDPSGDVIGFRAGNSTLVPYYKIHIDLRAIRRIVIGPTPKPKEAELAVRQLIAIKCLSCEPDQSKVPYRNW